MNPSGDDMTMRNKSRNENEVDDSVMSQDGNHGHDGDVTKDVVDQDDEERLHLHHIVNTFKLYKVNALKRLDNTERYLKSLPESHRDKLTQYAAHLEQVRVCIQHNQQVIKVLVKDVENMFENIQYSNLETNQSKLKPPSLMDIEKVHGILKQITREWSLEGEMERKSCFDPILQEIDEQFGALENKREIKILVPGAGLGRLAFEIARKGFACEGNEYSMFMLVTGNFILNQCKDIHIFCLYPWVNNYCNHYESRDQTTKITFPDVNPSDLPPDSDFTMAAGNFSEIYNQDNVWSCVATCFFIDTANNVVAYVEKIWKILKPGGVWINFGPLLYHYADMHDADSIEPSYDVVKQVILSSGFVMLKEKTHLPSYYTHNPRSMLSYQYRSVFFVCQKPNV